MARSGAIFRRHGSWDAAGETGPEIGNLAAGSGEPGRGCARGEEIRGAGVAEIPESGPSRICDERQLPTHNRHLETKYQELLRAIS